MALSDNMALFFLMDNTYLKTLIFCERGTNILERNLQRETLGEFATLYPELRKHDRKFFEYMRMRKPTFDYILGRIKDKINPIETNFGRTIRAEERLMLTLRFLATGTPFRTLAFSFMMGKTTVAKIVHETCDAIFSELQADHMPFPSVESLRNVANEFDSKWNFPNCVGCIDGKHIRLKQAKHSGTMYFNSKQFHSVVLQAVADAKCKFIAIDIGAYGKQSDGGVFRASSIYRLIEEKKLQLPADKSLPSSRTNQKFPHVLLADEAYPLLRYVMKPYSRQGLTKEEEIFNSRLFRARRCVECAFGMMTAKWRLLLKAIETSVPNAKRIVKCVALLHNIVIDLEGTTDVSMSDRFTRADTQLQKSRANNAAGNIAKCIRNAFRDYFNAEGAVPVPMSV